MGSSMMKYVRLATAGLGIAAAAACSHPGVGTSGGELGPLDREAAFVVFDNQSLDQADVYAIVSGGSPTRIGTVFPGRADTLRVPGSMVADGNGVNIVTRLLAHSYTPSSGILSLHPGDIFSVTLSSDGRNLIALPAR
jgi:hypothetical protein